MLYHRLFCIIVGALLDLIVGDPHWMPHPVRWIGRLVSLLERKLLGEARTGGESKDNTNGEGQKEDTRTRAVGMDRQAQLRAKGALLVVIVLLTTGLLTWLFLRVMYAVHPAAGTIAEIIICCYVLAARNLWDSARAVFTPLRKHNVEGARRAVSMIVGRDTSVLDEEGIIKATVETVAENTADGVIAPLFYLFLGGPVGGMLYKAINTMDSMLGYRNERYRYFGTAAAKLDDVAGFVPARISAVCLIVAASLVGEDAEGARKIFLRDRYRHESPNAGQSESVMAGALGVQLAGDAVYFGEVVHKPFIGDAGRKIAVNDIRRAGRMMFAAAGVCLAGGAVVLICAEAMAFLVVGLVSGMRA